MRSYRSIIEGIANSLLVSGVISVSDLKGITPSDLLKLSRALEISKLENLRNMATAITLAFSKDGFRELEKKIAALKAKEGRDD